MSDSDKFKIKKCITITANDPVILQRIYNAIFTDTFIDDIEGKDMRVSLFETMDYSHTLHIKVVKDT